jgi:hypothetical protein
MSMIVLLTLLLQGQVPDADAPRQNPVEPGIEWVALPPDLPQSLRDSVRFGYLEVPAFSRGVHPFGWRREAACPGVDPTMGSGFPERGALDRA